MANEFKIRKGLIVEGASGGTVVNVLGSQGQLLSVTDDLSGSIFAVSDISGVPIFDVNSSGISYFDGNVGIGTESPDSRLDVTGSGGVTVNVLGTTFMDFKYGAVGSETSRGTITTDGIDLTVNATADLLLLPTGNVGIGTTTPDAKLEVEKNVNGSHYSVFVKNTDGGSSAFVSKKWLNDDAGFGEIWRNSSTRTGTGQGPLSFNMYNSADINFWSGSTHTLKLSGNNATFTGDVTSQGYTIDAAGLQTFQDFQSKPIDDNSGLFTVGGNGMQLGYTRAISMWSSTDGVWNSWVGTNLRWDGTNFKRASDDGSANWGNIAGIRFLGNASTSGAAMQFIIDPPEQSSAPTGEQTIGTTLPASMTALSINNDLSATFAGTIAVQGTGDSYFDGKVGIGVTGPTSKLQVNYSAAPSFNANGGANALTLIRDDSGGDLNELGAGLVFAQRYINTATASIGVGGIYGVKTIASGSFGGGLAFYTQPFGSGSMDSRMIINHAGAIQFNAYDSTNNTGTPTYLLGTDASGNVVKVLDSGPGVQGSGTLRTIPMWTPNGNNIGNSVLKQDVANQNIGLGVTPETGMVTYIAQLRIGEQSGFQGHTDGVGQDSATWVTTNYKFTTTGNQFINGTVAAPGYANVYQQQLGDHSFSCSTVAGVAGGSVVGRSQMVIKQSGNVGIGVTGPLSKLELGPTGSLGANIINKNVILNIDGGYGTTGTATGGQYKVMGFVGTTRDVTDITAQTSGEQLKNFYLGTIGGDYFNGNRFSVWQGGAERLTIQGYGPNAGNIGIGTEDPDGQLDVTDGNSQMVFDGASSDRPLMYFRHNAVPVDGEEVGLLDFRGYNDASQDTRYVILTAKAEDVTDGSEDGSLSLLTMKAGTATNTMTLRSGNVGIGTDDPGYTLDITAATPSLTLQTSTNTNDPVITLKSSGPITSEGGQIWYRNNIGSLHLSTTYPATQSAIVFHTGTSTDQGINNERMRVTGDGGLLINATSSGYGSSGYGYMLGLQGSSTQCFMSMNYAGGALDTQGVIFGLDSVGAIWLHRENKPLRFFTNNTERMAVQGGGDVIFTNSVGIGTTSPSGKLDIQGTQGQLFSVTDDLSGSIFAVSDISGVPILNVNASGAVDVDGTFTATGDIVAYSDERLKTNIETLDGSKVYDMRGVSFTKDNKKSSGVIAQELEKIAPELINNDSQFKAVAYGNITGYLIEAIKELKAEIDLLKSKPCTCNKCNCNI